MLIGGYSYHDKPVGRTVDVLWYGGHWCDWSCELSRPRQPTFVGRNVSGEDGCQVRLVSWEIIITSTVWFLCHLTRDWKVSIFCQFFSLFGWLLYKKAARVEVNISLAFLHSVRIAFHPWPFVYTVAIFVLKGDVKLQLTN